MNTEYQSSYTDIFIKILLLVFIAGPITISIFLFANGDLSFKFFPLQIIAGVVLVYAIRHLLASDLIRFQNDVHSNKITPYLTFNYEEEEWRQFITGIYNAHKKGLYKFTLVMIAIFFLLLYLRTIVNEEKEILLFFNLLVFMIAINFIGFSYFHLIKPLKKALNSSERKINFYKHGVYIPESRYMIRSFGIYNGNHLFSIKKVDDDTNICFTDVIHDDNNIDPIKVKTKVLIPKKEYKIMTKLFKMY